jgi:UDP-N-acetylmuramoyl-tripeptide--D-alanyl-D-alanine ligase
MIGTLADIAAAVGGRLRGTGAEEVSGASFDSRTLRPGELFFAIEADRDGHDFVEAAVRAGAAGVVVRRSVDVSPRIEVDDTLAAWQALGAHRRRAAAVPVVALTGSCGKTTTRELVAAALSAAGPVHRSAGNLNNHLGVPLTLMGMGTEHAFAVVELGANQHGEIAALTAIADPDVGLVTCVAEAHTEFFGGLDGVERAKAELFANMRPESVAVVNLDDPRVRRMARGERAVTYGTDAGADVRLVSARPLDAGGQEVTFGVRGGGIATRLRLAGEHNALNAAGAVAVALACGVDPRWAAGMLEVVEPVWGRGGFRCGARLEVIDDTYNANPASVRAGLHTLAAAARGRRTVAVLGDMRELGELSGSLHRGVGAEAARLGVGCIVAVGENAASVREGALAAGADGVACFASTKEAIAAIGELVREDDLVLVKGSRAMEMERIVDLLVYW